MIKKLAIKLMVPVIAGCFLAACKNGTDTNYFEVKGKIKDAPGKMIFLDEVPAATMQRIAVDSAVLGSDGSYTVKAAKREACVYNLRIGKNGYPFAALINDSNHLTVDAQFSKTTPDYAEGYTVKGSPSSIQLQDFINQFTNDLERNYYAQRGLDSLINAGAGDSLIEVAKMESANAAGFLKTMTLQFIDKSTNPALTLFELGYFQSAANKPGLKVEGLSNDEVTDIVDGQVAKFPKHEGLASIKKSLDVQVEKMSGWIGKQAPEFKLPDVNGKEVSLSSFRGKYVLVDFWASWCGPCRRENQNVVSAYEKFKTKNFAILGVSLDLPDGKDEWMKAIRDDKLSWTQVSDLQYWESIVVGLYHIEGLPYNVLIDPEGKVIAERLHGSGLTNKLSEVLK